MHTLYVKDEAHLSSIIGFDGFDESKVPSFLTKEKACEAI